MKDDGFTLIELLAVILILSIISIILVPTVTNILEGAKKSSFDLTVNNVKEAIENECSKEVLQNKSVEKLYIIDNYNISPKIDIKGRLPLSGYIAVSDKCEAEAVNITDGKLFMYKDNVTKKRYVSSMESYGVKMYNAKRDDAVETTISNVNEMDLDNAYTIGFIVDNNDRIRFIFNEFYSNTVTIKEAEVITKALNDRLENENNTNYLDGFTYYINYQDKVTYYIGSLCENFKSQGIDTCDGSYDKTILTKGSTDEELKNAGYLIINFDK